MIRRKALVSCAAAPVLVSLGACVVGGGNPGKGQVTSTRGSGHLIFGNDGNIQIMGGDGSGRKALTKVPQGGLAKDPAWSPDGKLIAFSFSPPLPAVRGPGGMLPLPVTDVHVMDAGGGNQKTLIAHEAPGVGYESPVWAPDGKTLYLTYTELVVESNIVRDQVVEVARVPPGAGPRETLIPNGAFQAVSSDGKLLACIVATREGQAILISGVDGRNPRALVPAGQMEGLTSPRFSPDGKQLAFSAIAPSAPVPVPTTPARRSQGPLETLFATRVASAHGLPMDVYVVATDGGAPNRLTTLGEDNPSVAWSSDGNRLAILAGGGIYIAGARGESLVNLDPKGGHGRLDWKLG